MKKPYLIILLLGGLVSFTWAQDLDSLYAIWRDASQSDSNRVAAYKEYIQTAYLFTKPDSAVILADALLPFAQKHHYLEASAVAHNIKGVAYYLESNYTRSLEHYGKALAIWKKKGDKKGIASCYNNMGVVYKIQGALHLAIAHYQKSMAIREELGDSRGIANGLNNIGGIYAEQGNNPRALEYYEKSMAIWEKNDNKNGIASSLNNIGIIHKAQGQYSLALEHFEQALAIWEGMGDENGIAMSWNNLGAIYEAQGDQARAMQHYQKSLQMGETIGDKNSIANNLVSMGGVSLKQGQATAALNHCQQGRVLAEEIGILKWQKAAYQCLCDTYKELGKYNEALRYLEKANEVKDSLNVQQATQQLAQMEFAKIMLKDSIENAKEVRLVEMAHQEEIRQKNTIRNIFGGIGFFAFLLASGFYWQWNYVKRSKAKLQAEKDRSENLLLNILPGEIAAELKEKGRAEARSFDQASILFTDFKDFTLISEKLDAQDLVREINVCFKAFDAIVDKYGIEKIKTIGDSYMAAGGLPIPSPDSVKNTVLAALEMQHFVKERKKELAAKNLTAFEMRVGIHTGPVVAGIVGVKKFAYDIWGDTVNTASRMENAGQTEQVNASQSTYECLKEDPLFSFEKRGRISVKGKGEMEMYFVTLRTE